MDAFGFFMAWPAPFDILGLPGDMGVIAVMVGPTTMFNSTALPGNLNFLSQLTGAVSLWQSEPDGPGEDDFILEQIGTLTLTIPEGTEGGGGESFTPGPGPFPVPEPTTLALTALGVAGTLVQRPPLAEGQLNRRRWCRLGQHRLLMSVSSIVTRG